MNFRPLHDRVLVRRVEAEEKTAGGIIIPDTAKEKPQQGKVIAVGTGKIDDSGKKIPFNVKKGDKVQVLSGKDRGKQGVVLRALPAENKVVVEGVSVVKKAVKPNAANQQGGIVSQEAPIDASNVNLVCPECGKVTRVGHEKDGKNKLRVCKKCGHKF